LPSAPLAGDPLPVRYSCWIGIMRRLCIMLTAIAPALAGCVDVAKVDDDKCQSYGAKPGEPAYVQCRAQLDAARTQATATTLAHIDPTPSYHPPADDPVMMSHGWTRGL
jgi:hypothetical protein